MPNLIPNAKSGLNTMVKSNHPLRAVGEIISFERLAEGFQELEKETGRKGYGVEAGLRVLFLQFFTIYPTARWRSGCVTI